MAVVQRKIFPKRLVLLLRDLVQCTFLSWALPCICATNLSVLLVEPLAVSESHLGLGRRGFSTISRGIEEKKATEKGIRAMIQSELDFTCWKFWIFVKTFPMLFWLRFQCRFQNQYSESRQKIIGPNNFFKQCINKDAHSVNKQKLDFSEATAFRFTSGKTGLFFIKHTVNGEYTEVNVLKKEGQQNCIYLISRRNIQNR